VAPSDQKSVQLRLHRSEQRRGLEHEEEDNRVAHSTGIPACDVM